MPRRKQLALAELKAPELVVASGIIGNVLAAVADEPSRAATSALRTKVKHLLHVLQEWQAAYQKLRFSLDSVEEEILELRGEVSRLRERNARLEAAAARSAK
jgi:chromosome segregation ATPase